MGSKNVTPKNDIVETPQEKEALDRSRKVRKRINFLKKNKILILIIIKLIINLRQTNL
jgi:hypothetical protein